MRAMLWLQCTGTILGWCLYILTVSSQYLPYGQFTCNEWTFKGQTFLYRETEICGNDESLPAFVLYLHGGHSRGSDNETQLAVKIIGQYLLSHHIHAILAVPQCPDSLTWGKETSDALEDLSKDISQEK